AGEGGGLARQGALPRAGALAELLIDERALGLRQAAERLGVHLLDRLGRRRAQQVAVALDRALILARRFASTRGRGRGGGLVAHAEGPVQESHALDDKRAV